MWRQEGCRTWCMVLHLPRAVTSVSGCMTPQWKEGTQYMFFLPSVKEDTGYTHTHAHSPSWLPCSTTVSLQFWALRNPCSVQKQRVILQYQGTRSRGLMKKQDKSLKLSSCHHLFNIKLHLAKVDKTTNATSVNCMHKTMSQTIKSGLCHIDKPPPQSKPDVLSPPLCKIWYRVLLERASFAVAFTQIYHLQVWLSCVGHVGFVIQSFWQPFLQRAEKLVGT